MYYLYYLVPHSRWDFCAAIVRLYHMYSFYYVLFHIRAQRICIILLLSTPLRPCSTDVIGG